MNKIINSWKTARKSIAHILIRKIISLLIDKVVKLLAWAYTCIKNSIE